jgi:octaprenyl-diphosphate synthase
LRNSNAAQSQMIRNAIEQGGLEHLPQVIEAVKKSGALEHVKKLAESEAAICRSAIEHFPESKFKQALVELASFAVSRSF